MPEYKAIPEENYPVIDDNNSDTQPSIGSFEPVVPLDSNTTWFVKYWRPAIAWQYLFVCLFDFIIAPSLVGTYLYTTGADYVQWQPLTLMASGFYHIAMGAIIGVAAYGRTKEKLMGIDV
jgi:hypothetical protein